MFVGYTRNGSNGREEQTCERRRADSRRDDTTLGKIGQDKKRQTETSEDERRNNVRRRVNSM